MNAALAVIDTVGIDRLTIRSVAKLASAPPMSLYTHFSNKGELLDLVYTEIARRLWNDDSSHSTWQSSMLALCRHVHSVLMEHPRWIALLSRPAGPYTPASRERILKLMVEDGFTPEFAMAALTSATMTTIGLVLVDVTLRDPDGQAAMTKRYDRLRAWAEATPTDENTVTRTAVLKLRRLNLEENFLLAIRSLIAGLESLRGENARVRELDSHP